MKIIVAILIILIFFISGCVDGIPISCEPNWVLGNSMPILRKTDTTEDSCKTLCYKNYEVTSYKIEEKTESNTKLYYCYCDVKDCNPKP